MGRSLKFLLIYIYRNLIRSSCGCGSSYCSNRFFNCQNVLELLKKMFLEFFYQIRLWSWWQLLVQSDVKRPKIKLLPLTDQTALFLFPFLLQFSSLFSFFIMFFLPFCLDFHAVTNFWWYFHVFSQNKAAAADRPNCSISFPIFTAIFIVFSEYLHFFIWVFSRCWLWWILLFLLLNFLALGKIFSGFGFATEAMALGRC